MRVLAVDTATSRQSVAVAEDGEVLGEVRLRAPAGRHAQRLMPSVAFLLEALGLAPRDLQGLAVTVGPGSFTGLRVGLSAVQGIALGGGMPALGVGTLEVLARHARGAGPMVAAVVDAYRGQVYAAVYGGAGDLAQPPRVDTPEAFAERLPAEVALVGDGAERYRALFQAARPRASFVAAEPYLAATLARLAAPRLAAGEGGPASALRPQYLRDADIGRCGPA